MQTEIFFQRCLGSGRRCIWSSWPL